MAGHPEATGSRGTGPQGAWELGQTDRLAGGLRGIWDQEHRQPCRPGSAVGRGGGRGWGAPVIRAEALSHVVP